MATTITLDWDPPQGSGPEAIVDNYTVSISPDPPFQPTINHVILPPWNVTLTHNVEYTVYITAFNCFGESGRTVLSRTYSKCAESIVIMVPNPLFLVNCGAPENPTNGTASNYPHTREGAISNYQCDEGFRPSQLFYSTCTGSGEWIPSPELHVCTLVTG